MELQTNQEDRNLEPRTIGSLNGLHFRIPSYQRGYRWERLQVQQLLNDLAEADDSVPYYLQPIVVAPMSETEESREAANVGKYFDIIDGQQRLTTIYLILQAFTKLAQPLSGKDEESLTEEEKGKRYAFKYALGQVDTSANFSLSYQTRTDSEVFLQGINRIDESDKSIRETPDHLYMWHAFQCVIEWMGTQKIETVSKVAGMLKSKVKVIWYQLSETITDWKKFTDLNIGKIPLTNSELIKALFLRTTNFCTPEEKDGEEYLKQTLVAQWDQIERELSSNAFWGFLSRDKKSDYPTKIDLLFDLISQKKNSKSQDALYTFSYFVKLFANNKATGLKMWEDIYLKYQRLKDWYEDRDMYHMLGYLIAIDYPANALERIFKIAHPENRCYRSTDIIKNVLARLVSMSLRIPDGRKFEGVKSFEDLRYNISDDPDRTVDTSHHYMIKRYLTLYNILVTEYAGKKMRYPFDFHNTVDGGWSLEHIHAQNSQTLNKGWQWEEWINNHADSLQRLVKSLDEGNELLPRIDNLIVRMASFSKQSNRDEFDKIADDFREIMESFPGAKGLYQDEMANMALLGKYNNSTLNNSTFDVKRQKVIRLLGTNFVPLATERVFLKAITGEMTVVNEDETVSKSLYSCDTEHLFFWGKEDRMAYIDDMKTKLKKYLNRYE